MSDVMTEVVGTRNSDLEELLEAIETDSTGDTSGSTTTREDGNNFICYIKMAVRELPNKKLSGVDELTADMIKTTGCVGIWWLYTVMQVIQKKKKIPED